MTGNGKVRQEIKNAMREEIRKTESTISLQLKAVKGK
jgi:hypothetical protein